MDFKWETDEKNLFDYHFRVGDYVSIKGGNGDLKLAKVEQVKDARLWVKLVNFGNTSHHNRHRGYRWGYRMSESSTFLVTAQDFIKKGYPLYKKKVEEIKERNKNFHQDCVNYNATRGNPQKIKKPSYTKLIRKKLNESEAPVEYQSIYNYFTPNIRSGRAIPDHKNNDSGWSYSKRKEESESEEEEDEQYEIKILTEEEYQQIVEKMSYNKFLNQFIKQEQIDRELKIENSTNNSNNKNSKIKTFEINDKRVKRFAMKYIKPEDLEQRLNQIINNNNNNNNSKQEQQELEQEEVEQNQFEYNNNNNNIDNDDNYYYYNDNNQDGLYNNQVYQEEVYYIEPEEVVTFDDYNNQSFDYYNSEKVGSGGSSGSSGSGDGKVENDKIIFKQNEVFKKLEKELHVSTNHYYNEDYERLINTFNSGFILQDELHQRRMDLLRDHFNIDLSKFQI
ncbi:hypothetical protein ACTFIW_004966 [Dictyostelium discoideum]